jgi:DNA polymerase III sliding clamp (beta) subunit (PCNA family)
MQGCKAYQECFFLVNINYLIDCLKQFEKAEGPVYVRNNKDKTGSWMFSLQNSSDFDLVMPMRGDKEELWFEDVKQDN